MSTIAQSSRRHDIKWWAGRTLLAVVALIGLLSGGALAAGASARATLKSKYPPIGQLVDVGGYKLHIYCEGTGSPTVVLDSGNGGLGVAWSLVYPQIARTTRVCIYDRAGYGWSDVGPQPRHPRVMAEELYALLNKSNVASPYVMVSHSYGGLVARQFNAQYPNQVAGMVFVDSAHEEQYVRFPQAVTQKTGQMLAPFRIMAVVASTGVLALNPSAVWNSDAFPQQTREMIQALIASNPNHIATILAEVEGVFGKPASKPALLGNMPLVVLSHGKLDADALPADTPPDVRQVYEQTWQELQAELAGLSSNSTRIVAEKSGHNIQVEQPDLVIDAVQQVVAAARQ